jgi:hypothetical protein
MSDRLVVPSSSFKLGHLLQLAGDHDPSRRVSAQTETQGRLEQEGSGDEKNDTAASGITRDGGDEAGVESAWQ